MIRLTSSNPQKTKENNKMKRITILLILFALASCANAEYEPVAEAQAHFDKGQYPQGRDVLHKALGDESISSSQKAEVFKTLAQFYEELVGDNKNASKFYSRILKTDLPADHQLKSLAQKEISRIEERAKKYSQQNAYLKKLRLSFSKKLSENESKEQIAQLQTIANDYPQYYRLPEVYYYLGRSYTNLKQYHKAYKLLCKTEQLKPAVNFYLPVIGNARAAHGYWVRATVNKTTWGALGTLLILTVILFYTSCPWRWVTSKHLLIGSAVVLLYALIFALSFTCLAAAYQPTEKIISGIGVEVPAFVGAAIKSPGSGIVKYLFLYGLVAILGVFVFAIATARLKCKLTTAVINALFGLILTASMLTVFYMRYCDRKSVVNSQAKSTLYYPKANIYFRQYDLEPFILTNPKAYPDLNLGNIPNHYFLEWVTKHSPLTNSNEK